MRRWVPPTGHGSAVAGALSDDDRRALRTIHAICLTFLAATAIVGTVLFLVPDPPKPIGLAIMGGAVVLTVASLILARQGRPGAASAVLIAMTWLATTAGVLGAGGLDAPAVSFYAVSIVAAGLLIGSRAALGVALLSAAASGAIAWAAATGRIEPVIVYPGISLWWIEMTLFAAITGLIVVSVNRVREALGEARESKAAADEHNRELVRAMAEMERAQRAEALLHEAMDQASEAILMLDPEGSIRYANTGFLGLVRERPEALAGRRFAELLGGVDEGARAEGRRLLARGGVWRGQLELPRGDEAPATLECSFTAVRDASGAVTSVVGVLRDVTRERELEARLRQSQKMEALGQLAGGVAHDFNNLLVVIQGCASLLAREGHDDPSIRESVEQIDEASSRAAELTSALLAFGRRQVPHARVLDLNAVVRETMGMLRRIVPENVAIDLLLDEELGHVRADPGQLNQILLNLVANARDALPEGGKITLRTTNVAQSSGSDADDAEWVELAVSDDGLGMSEATRERIFEPFFTTKEVDRGTGLGLASVYGIVEQCGGEIDVESDVGCGTTFRVRLPRTAEPLAEAEPAPRASPTLRRGARILLVEDQDAVRRLVRMALAEAGFSVLEAADGQAALDLLETLPEGIEGVITDVIMPRIAGPQLVARLRERWPGLRVLYTSGYSPDRIEDRIEDDPHAEFVAKPFVPSELVERLKELLARD